MPPDIDEEDTEQGSVTVTLTAEDLAGDADALKVAADDQKPKTGEVDKKPDASKKVETAAKIETADDGIEELRRQHRDQLAAQQSRTADAERRAQEAGEKATTFEGKAFQAEYDAVLNGIDATKGEITGAKRDYAAAMESGDYAKAADAQEKLAIAASRIGPLEDAKLTIEHRRQQQKDRPKDQQREPRQQQPPRQFASATEFAAAAFTPKTADFLDQHPDLVVQGANGFELSKKAIRAHEDAVDEGYVPDSRAYFRFIEDVVGAKDAAAKSSGDTTPKGRPAKGAPAAPVSRETGGAAALNGQQIRLSAREVQAAKDLDLTPTEYAKRKAIMMGEGRYAVPSLPSE